MFSSIDLIGTTLDIENDHISDNTKKTCDLCLIQFVIFLCDNHQEILSSIGSLIVENNKDNQNKYDFLCIKSIVIS